MERLPLFKKHHENHTKDQHVRKSIIKKNYDRSYIYTTFARLYSSDLGHGNKNNLSFSKQASRMISPPWKSP